MQHQNQIIFETISEIPAWLEEQDFISNSGADMGRSDSWDLRLGYEGALEMAADGGYWAEGASKMIEATTRMDELKRDGFVEEIDYDVAGAYLDMEEYLDGSPECFVSVNDEQPVRLIKIGVQQYSPGGNDASEFIYRGAALMSVIDDLEANGCRVELWGCTSGSYRRDAELPIDERQGVDMRTCLKRAEEAWSPSSVAFGIAHPAFGRRLGFRAAASFENNSGYLGAGHGLDHHHDRPAGSDFDVWFGYSDMVATTYSSVEFALKRITAEVEKQLKEGKEYANVE